MNRNIITEDDIQTAAVGTDQPGDGPVTGAAGTRTVQKADDYFDRLVKYVPLEIIGAYLIVDGLLRELLEGQALSIGLLALLVLGLLAAWFFANRVLNVVRTNQLVMTAIAFLVYVFATGGWFATFPFWAPAWGTIAVVLFGVAVRIVGIPPLTQEQVSRAMGARPPVP